MTDARRTVGERAKRVADSPPLSFSSSRCSRCCRAGRLGFSVSWCTDRGEQRAHLPAVRYWSTVARTRRLQHRHLLTYHFSDCRRERVEGSAEHSPSTMSVPGPILSSLRAQVHVFRPSTSSASVRPARLVGGTRLSTCNGRRGISQSASAQKALPFSLNTSRAETAPASGHDAKFLRMIMFGACL